MPNIDESLLGKIVDYNKDIIEGVDGNTNNVIDKIITLEYRGHNIWNPFRDETLRYKVKPEDKYGEKKVIEFIKSYTN
jgi:hypothetical protein